MVSRDQGILDRARRFSRQGLIRNPEQQVYRNQGPWHQEVHELGWNYRLTDLQAALGSSQLKRIETFKSSRKRIWTTYNEAFRVLEHTQLPTRRSYADPMWHLYALRVPRNYRREFFVAMRSRGIGVQVNYWPAHLHPAFRALRQSIDAFPVARDFYGSQISLPLHTTLTHESVDQVIRVTKEVYELLDTSAVRG